MNQEDFVLPQQFGARADGKADDTSALVVAIREAKENNLILKIPEGEYRTTNVLVLDQINVYCENARISFYGTEKNLPALELKEHVNLCGKIHIWFVDNENINNEKSRCGIAFGNHGTGGGACHCHVEEIGISGGSSNGIGVFITGDSHDIQIDKVIIPKGTKLGYGIMIHWGNADQHKPKDPKNPALGYEHSKNAEPTKHPHDIHIGTLISAGYDTQNGKFADQSAFYIAGGYQITCKEIIADGMQNALTVTGGDFGFEFASETERAGGMFELRFGKISASNLLQNGVHYTVNSNYFGCLPHYGELIIGELNIDGAQTGLSICGLKKAKIGKMNLKNIKTQGLYFTGHTTNLEIDKINLIENCNGEAIFVTRHQNESICQNIKIGILSVKHNGENYSKALIFANAVDGFRISEIILPKSFIRTVLTTDIGAANVSIGRIKKI